LCSISRRCLRRSIYQLRAPPAIAFCLCLHYRARADAQAFRERPSRCRFPEWLTLIFRTANFLDRAERWLKGRMIRISFMAYENGKKGTGAFVDRVGCPAGRLLLPLVWKQDLACGGTRCIRQGPGHGQFVFPYGQWVGLSVALLALWLRSRGNGILMRTRAPARREN